MQNFSVIIIYMAIVRWIIHWQKHGFHKDDITDVILTHLHFDHCGGSIIRDGDKLFLLLKMLCYWSNEEHWQWAIHPNDREKASFLKRKYFADTGERTVTICCAAKNYP